MSKWLLPALHRIWGFYESVVASEFKDIGMKPLFVDGLFAFPVAVLARCWDVPSSKTTAGFTKSKLVTHIVPVLCEHKGQIKLSAHEGRDALVEGNTSYLSS